MLFFSLSFYHFMPKNFGLDIDHSLLTSDKVEINRDPLAITKTNQPSVRPESGYGKTDHLLVLVDGGVLLPSGGRLR